jgi:flagellar assembly factor FliW
MAMKIESLKFGTIEIDDSKIIHMPFGMPGFSEMTRFVVIEKKEMNPFCLFQSVDDPGLAFFMIDPSVFISDYRIDEKDILEKAPWKDKSDELSLFVIVNVPEGNPRNMTANLVGPVVINNRTKEGIQLVLYNSPYSYQYPILQGDEKADGV